MEEKNTQTEKGTRTKKKKNGPSRFFFLSLFAQKSVISHQAKHTARNTLSKNPRHKKKCTHLKKILSFLHKRKLSRTPIYKEKKECRWAPMLGATPLISLPSKTHTHTSGGKQQKMTQKTYVLSTQKIAIYQHEQNCKCKNRERMSRHPRLTHTHTQKKVGEIKRRREKKGQNGQIVPTLVNTNTFFTGYTTRHNVKSLGEKFWTLYVEL